MSLKALISRLQKERKGRGVVLEDEGVYYDADPCKGAGISLAGGKKGKRHGRGVVLEDEGVYYDDDPYQGGARYVGEDEPKWSRTVTYDSKSGRTIARTSSQVKKKGYEPDFEEREFWNEVREKRPNAEMSGEGMSLYGGSSCACRDGIRAQKRAEKNAIKRENLGSRPQSRNSAVAIISGIKAELRPRMFSGVQTLSKAQMKQLTDSATAEYYKRKESGKL